MLKVLATGPVQVVGTGPKVGPRRTRHGDCHRGASVAAVRHPSRDNVTIRTKVVRDAVTAICELAERGGAVRGGRPPARGSSRAIGVEERCPLRPCLQGWPQGQHVESRGPGGRRLVLTSGLNTTRTPLSLIRISAEQRMQQFRHLR
jgi:hypothetical protein